MFLSSKWLIGAARTIWALRSTASRVRCFATIADGIPSTVPEEKVRLREYQEECIQSVLSYLERGHKRLGVSLATGAGKTIIFTQLIDRYKPANNNARQTLIIAHRRELVEQAAQQCEKAYPGKTVQIDMGAAHATGAADITVASIQSLNSWERIEKYKPKRFKLVLVDEAHHIVAPGYLRVLEHFGLYSPKNILEPDAEDPDPDPDPRAPTVDGPALVGVSATFSRFDGMRLGAAIDHIVYHKDYVDMIGEKWLSDVRFTTVRSHANLSSVKTTQSGDFSTPSLSHAVNNDETNSITITSWLSEAGSPKSTLVFCVDIAHVLSLTSMFRKHGIDARYITGTTRKKERSECLEAFKRREYPVLLNCAVFTEGTDMPNIDCVLLARPTKSRNLLVQMIGRGMRLYPGKTDCHVVDMVASLETGIATVPTLFGLDPSEIVKSASAADLKYLKDRESQPSSSAPIPSGLGRDISNTTLSFTHYSTVHDLILDTSGERHIRAISPNAWVQVGNEKYVLNSFGGILTLECPSVAKAESTTGADDDHYVAIWKHPLPPTAKTKSPYSKPRVVATATTLTAALRAADTFAASKFDRIFIVASSAWRKGPATDGQLSFLNKLRDVTEEEPLTPEDLSKGQAADMITKIKFGARGRFDKLMVKRRAEERKREKVMVLRGRESVRVGPLET